MQEINKYPYKAQGRKMKVLIETIARRRGYKNFADEAEFDDFLAQNYNKITGYQILQEKLKAESGKLSDELEFARRSVNQYRRCRNGFI